MARPVIALLTDFGLRDHYAGTLKGVALGICPDATFVDISHEVPPQDVVAGALELAAAYRFFPGDTVFLVVVDPGVGSARRAIAATAGGYRFVAPDNGILSIVFDRTAPEEIVELTERRYMLPVISRTFEGRDRFAPVAAWLANGVELALLGPPARDVCRLNLPVPTIAADTIAGEVVRVDRFGNLITNIERAMFEPWAGTTPRIAVGKNVNVINRIVSTYADVAPGELCALFGSSDHLEVAVHAGNAARELHAARGTRVTVLIPIPDSRSPTPAP